MAHEIQFILYNMPEGNGTVHAIVRDETVWLTQKAMGELFGVDRSVITKHLKNIFESAELQEVSVCAKIAHTASDGKTEEAKAKAEAEYDIFNKNQRIESDFDKENSSTTSSTMCARTETWRRPYSETTASSGNL